jgi:hypothetical protein
MRPHTEPASPLRPPSPYKRRVTVGAEGPAGMLVLDRRLVSCSVAPVVRRVGRESVSGPY